VLLTSRFERWLVQPPWRLELVRILAPLAVLGFFSGRLAHAPEWLGSAGFRIPDLGGGDWRQPLFVPALPDWASWVVAACLVGAGLALSLGFHSRPSALLFAGLLVFVALADRLAAFTVSKLSPVIMLALALSPCGQRFSVDAWRRRRRGRPAPPSGPIGAVRFLQILLPAIYSASGIAKLQGDWLTSGDVLWTLVHDSYQTPFSWALARALPSAAWPVLQGATLLLEVGAPLWFALPRTRPIALYAAVTMHAFIGLMFGPVKWFALLMMVLWLGAYLPENHCRALHHLLVRIGPDRSRRRHPRL
jgi:uncharacterized membrane protein YphA (DoxX/SURF4 family)